MYESASSESQPNWERCLCHITESNEKLTLFSEKSWKKFTDCSKRRSDQTWQTMKNHFSNGPKGGYHRKCYQRYTNIGHISRIEEAAVSNVIVPSSCTEVQQNEEPPAKRLHRSDVNEFDINKCIICQKEKGKVGNEGQRIKETLSLNISEYGSEALLRAAEVRKDDSVLLQIKGQDCIAREIKYHRSCYKNYVRTDRLAKLESEDCEAEDKCNGYKKAFEKVQNYVKEEVIANYRVVTMSALAEKFVSYLIQEEVDVDVYRTSKLKLRLKRTFGEQLAFQRPKNARQSELVYNAKVKKGEIIEHMFSYSSMSENGSEVTEPEHECEANNTYSQVYHTSKQLRSILLDLKNAIPWPPSPDDLRGSDSDLVPDLLYNMLAWILTSNTDFSSQRVGNLPSHVHRWILSLGQDLIHCVTRGRIKTPKHIALPVTVKSLTGNAEVITLLNRFGHGLSYSQIEELETAIAEQQISNSNDGVVLPSACSPSIPAVFCWDNNDLQEETLSGNSFVV